MPKIAIACCYNNELILKSMLENGIKEQSYTNIEKIYFNNKFDSAAKAYNYVLDNYEAEIYVYVHQDLKFLDSDFLSDLIKAIEEDKKAIYGLCGSKMENGKNYTYSNVYHGLLNKNIGKQISEVKEVEGLDEIFIAFHKDVKNEIRFDEKTFNGWHLFVEDICLQAKLKGIKVKVLPLLTQHKNSLEMPRYMKIYGIYPKEYFLYLKRIRNKYKKKIENITCPCVSTSTSFISFYKTYLSMMTKMNFKKFFRQISLKDIE